MIADDVCAPAFARASGSCLTCTYLNSAIGVTVTPVPYRGAPQGLQDLMAGRIDHYCPIIAAAIAHIENKTMKPIAVVPTANLKRLTATANRLIVAPNERSFQVDLVRLDRNIPTAGCVSRDPCPSTSTHRAAAQIPEAIGVR